MPELSVILATVNDSIACNLTCANLITYLEWDDIDYEIIFLDNNSLPEEKLILQQFLRYHAHFSIKYFNFDITGTIPIHAFGIEKASGKYIVMPEPHMIYSPGYFKIMLDTLKELKPKGVEMVWSPFIGGNVGRKKDNYTEQSHFGRVNPFARPNSIGPDCKLGDPIKLIMANAFSAMICEKEWMLRIGNMFPDAFAEFGGYCAESLMIGILTWMFGKKCCVQPKVVTHHPVYRIQKGPGRNQRMQESMVMAAYITGGDKYMLELEKSYGAFSQETYDRTRIMAKSAKEYVDKNTVLSLDYLVKNWEELKNEPLV